MSSADGRKDSADSSETSEGFHAAGNDEGKRLSSLLIDRMPESYAPAMERYGWNRKRKSNSGKRGLLNDNTMASIYQ